MATTFSARPFSTAAPGGAGAADRRWVAISTPAVAVAAAGRSSFPGDRGGIFPGSVTPLEDACFLFRLGRGELPGLSWFLEGVLGASGRGIARFRDPGVAAARRLIALEVAVPEEVGEESGILRCGSVLGYILRCVSVRFSEIRNPTMRFGAIFRHRKSYGAVRCCDISYGAVRRGSPLNGFFYGAAPIPVGKPYNTVFSPRRTV